MAARERTAPAEAFDESLPQYLPLDDDQWAAASRAGDADADVHRYLVHILGSEEGARDIFEAEEALISVMMDSEVGDADEERFTPPGPRVSVSSAHPSPFGSRPFFPPRAEYGGAGAGVGGPADAATTAAAAVSSLQKQKYKKATSGGGGGGAESLTECVICMEEFEVDDDLRVMPCVRSHRFHEKCLAQWLPRKRSCPLCRHVLQTYSPNIIRFV